MTIEAGLVALLAPLVGGRVYPAPAPRDVASPFLTYQRITTTPYERTVDPTVKPLEAVLMQLDCYAEDSSSGGATGFGYEDAVDLAAAVRAALFNSSSAFTDVEVDDVEFAEEQDLGETGAHGPIWRRSLSFNLVQRS